MSRCHPILSRSDHRRLSALLLQDDLSCIADSYSLEQHYQCLASATIVPHDQLPPTVVSMHSVVQMIDPITNEEAVYTLVYPSEARIEMGRLSVLAPLGVAILGREVGQSVWGKILREQKGPAGYRWRSHSRRLRIADLFYQPQQRRTNVSAPRQHYVTSKR